MKPFSALVIPVTGQPFRRQLSSWEEMVDCVEKDCTVQRLDLHRGLVAYLDEDGIAKQLPRNNVATEFVVDRLLPFGEKLLPGDFIKGVMVLVNENPIDEDSTFLDVAAHDEDCVMEVWQRLQQVGLEHVKPAQGNLFPDKPTNYAEGR